MSIRRLLPFVLLNIVVSAVVVLAILYWWDSRQEEDEQPDLAIAGTSSLVEFDAEEPAEDPSPTPDEVEPTPGPPTYLVQPGDTLGTISQEFEVSLEALMEANGLTDPNFLQVNQELIIPVATPAEAEVEVEEAIPTTEPAGIPSPIPTEDIGSGEAVIQLEEIIGAGNLEEEAVAISNTGERPVALLGWTLTDGSGLTYTFGQVTLFGEGAAITLHTGSGQDGPSDIYWGLEEAVWDSEDTITLFDAEGTTRSTLQVGSQ